jgi:hypothetical protein
MTRRSTSPGHIGTGPGYGRAPSRRSQCRTGYGRPGSWSAARRMSASAATGPTCRTQPTVTCGPDWSRRAPLCSSTRKALAYSVAFAARTALSLVKAGEGSAAGRQAYEAVRCAWMMPGGVPVHEESIPAAR